MGRVFLAREDALDRRVAIKLIAEDLQHPDARRRFQREARALARIDHPNVVRIYRLGIVHGRPYIVYELVAGESLDRLVASRDAWRTALYVGRGLARGLAAVHRAGVLHRDIKPSNVMLASDGVVKLLDFGLATFTEPMREEPVEELIAPVRVTGPAEELTVTLPVLGPVLVTPASDVRTGKSAFMGTPRYMAPELWRGARASVASDLYAVGLILFELCGIAFERRDGSERLPRLVDAREDIPKELAHIVDRCLETDPSARFASADELVRALDAIALAPHTRVSMIEAEGACDEPSPKRATPPRVALTNDGSAQRGADNVVRACLGVRAGETVVVLRWRAHEEASILVRALERASAHAIVVGLEDDEEDPTPRVAAALAPAQRSILVARHGLPSQLSMAVLDTTMRRRIPHLHLTRTERRLFEQSYRADPKTIAEINARVLAVLASARAILVNGRSGTSLRIVLSPSYPLLCSDGRPEPGRPDNLPSGYIAWHPADVTGTYTADRQLLGMVRFGRDKMAKAPVRFTFRDGRVTGVSCDDAEVLEQVRAYLAAAPNTDRVGLVSLPTNYVVRMESGMEVQDALLAGISLGLGYSNPQHSKAPYACPLQLRLFARRLDVRVEGGAWLVRNGRLADDWVRGIDPFR